MTNAIIIHGAYGNPEENWFPWLKKELESLDCRTEVPTFPTPKNQNLRSWMGVFEKYEKNTSENTILIGHSIGATFILNILEKSKAKAAFLISGFLGLLGNSEVDPLNKTISNKEFNWETIKNNCKKFYIFQSGNDPYVPLAKAKELGEKLGTKVILVENAGHFNKKSGYTTFNLLLETIKKEI